MMLKAYLTIDDSPSRHTDVLTDFLAKNDMPAMLFCRGDHFEENPDTVVRAIERNMIIANHNYSHRPAGDLSYDDIVVEIEKTENLIDDAYKKAGKARAGKYFRFPYIDRGDGDRLERRFAEIIGNPAAALPSDEKVARLQEYLKAEGFCQPFKNVTHPLYQNKDVAGAADCFFTYSSCDWMLTERHKGQWDYKTPEDLKAKIDDDPWLCRAGGAQIVLFHDQPEIEGAVMTLLGHMQDKGFEFLDFGT